ncbi:hypothetical protein QYE76_052572 [Lolium multiflorum]|uniref:Uncharacterized protein n=1 Tax=Lolium multiflorum TaxID=4521 RepID=A0AAD8SVV0_LOLMU|nr:hypothetical protein QYE76_052572 [Lolium multiflorum]
MGELLTEHDGGDGVDGDGFRALPVPAGCRDRDFVPELNFAMVAAPGVFLEFRQETPVASGDLHNSPNDVSEGRGSSEPVDFHIIEHTSPKSGHDDPIDSETVHTSLPPSADDTCNTEGSVRDDDADHDAFVNAAAEENGAPLKKRSIGGFADEDDLLDIDEAFVEPPPKRVRSDAASPVSAASEASVPKAARSLRLLPFQRERCSCCRPAPPSDLRDGAIKKAAIARQEVDSLKEELNKLKEKLKEEEFRSAEKDELLCQSALALLEAASIPATALDKVPNNSPANGVSMALASHQLTRELLNKGKGALARMHSMIFPKVKKEKTLGQLIDAFAVDTKETIEVFPVPSFVDDSSGVLPEGDRIQRMKDRITRMEKDLRDTYTLAAIVNKKSEIAADVERYALRAA